MILESAKKMGTLIDDLLAFSRIGRAETHKSIVSLQQLVQEALSEVAQETEGRNIVWRVGTLPAWYGDRAMLRLVLVNLISNAVKFTRTRPRAEIEIASTNHRPDELIVLVRDNGVGFDMKYVNKLFGVFQRLHGPETFRAPVSGWPRCSASCIGTAAGSGRRAWWTRAPRSIFRCPSRKEAEW